MITSISPIHSARLTKVQDKVAFKSAELQQNLPTTGLTPPQGGLISHVSGKSKESSLEEMSFWKSCYKELKIAASVSRINDKANSGKVSETSKKVVAANKGFPMGIDSHTRRNYPFRIIKAFKR